MLREVALSVVLGSGMTFAIASNALAESNDAGTVATEVVTTESRPAGQVGTDLPETPADVSGATAKAAASEKTAKVAETAPSRSARPLSGSAPESLRARIAHYAAQHGVPYSLADAVIRVESRYNPRAANAGNYGLMQIRHQTARGIGYSGSASGLLDAETNLRYGMAYLAKAYQMAGGDTCGTVMRYQSGHMATRMNGANRTYCAKVRTIVASN